MDSRFWWSFLLALAMASAGARSQSTDAIGFLSIDCGIEPGSSYVDPTTGISYVSDTGFIDTGVNRNISDALVGDVSSLQLHTLRAFPNGARNCYTIGSPAVVQGSKYLLRTWFLYGNYDAFNGQPQSFDLYLGVNYWGRVNVTTPESIYWTEIITVATTGDLSLCLVNIGMGTPFISGIDVRPLMDNLYPAANERQTLVLFNRLNFGEESNLIRYPADPIDRVWAPWSSSQSNWNDVSTDSTVQNIPQDFFQVPSVVMQTAVTPIDSSSLVFTWDPTPGNVNQFFPILHISEIVDLSGTSQSRQFNIYVNGIRWLGNIMTPTYLTADAVYGDVPIPPFPTYNISLEALSNSTLPPILNALEIYMILSNTSVTP
ncbi:putative leucine-rich repeat receptor-like protein kinase At2g19210 [Curcuma longa]|uniref:putative leucine-rich repeat receptor-like protein kinase At2g19210 n=1 Tax=Curcuma longa TaxID=136217 RepID=UPI003D9E5390